MLTKAITLLLKPPTGLTQKQEFSENIASGSELYVFLLSLGLHLLNLHVPKHECHVLVQLGGGGMGRRKEDASSLGSEHALKAAGMRRSRRKCERKKKKTMIS